MDCQNGDDLVAAILKDDVGFIKKSQHSSLFCLEAACICESPKTTFFLLENENINIEEAEYAIAYALSTGNMNFTLNLARRMKAKGQKNSGPALLYAFGNFSNFDKVKQIFL